MSKTGQADEKNPFKINTNDKNGQLQQSLKGFREFLPEQLKIQALNVVLDKICFWQCTDRLTQQ